MQTTSRTRTTSVKKSITSSRNNKPTKQDDAHRQADECTAAPTADELGSGMPHSPIRQRLPRDTPNTSGCVFCPAPACSCNDMTKLLDSLYDDEVTMQRILEVAGNRSACAKSLLPPFVSRLVRTLNITADDCLYDLGCGNGSIIFQVALTTGASCIGIELCPNNARLAQEALTVLRGKSSKFRTLLGKVSIQQGDLVNLISKDSFITPLLDDEEGAAADTPTPTTKVAAGSSKKNVKLRRRIILTSNLLFPKSLTAYMSERFRSLPVGSIVICFDDLYPHSRSVAKVRDPEAFELFDMKDFLWTPMTVEWCAMPGSFYIHTRV